MAGFYRKFLPVFLCLVCLTSALAFVCFSRFFVSAALLPAHKSVIPWKAETITDVVKGGSSSISVNESDTGLDYDYVLTDDVEYPNVTLVVDFAGPKNRNGNTKKLADLTGYAAATFRIKCSPPNLLSVYFHSLDETITDPGNFSTYRIAEAPVPCSETWSDVEIDLRHLKVPAWWLETFKLEVSDQRYWLDKVTALSIGASRQGPINTPANVKIGELTLHGREWRYAWIFAGVSAVVWACFTCWLFRQYTKYLIADVKDKLQKNRPLIAYQRLSVETPRKDREKIALMRLIATRYADPDLSLEKAAAALGVNRTKINDILKQELGFTFSAYLNKLRLAEAARLLSEKGGASVAEIAYSVGYSNVSYFNKLFKNEYGHTPKTFKSICKSHQAEEHLSPDTNAV